MNEVEWMKSLSRATHLYMFVLVLIIRYQLNLTKQQQIDASQLLLPSQRNLLSALYALNDKPIPVLYRSKHLGLYLERRLTVPDVEEIMRTLTT